MNEQEQYIRDKIQDAIDDLMYYTMRANEVMTGDIAPWQQYELDVHIDAMARLLYAVLRQNTNGEEE